MITTINEYRLILEIGEATVSPYEFTAERDSTYPNTLQGYFTTESGINYTVTGWLKELREWDTLNMMVFFHTDLNKEDAKAETNRNEQYKVMSTVIAIVKRFLVIVPEINDITFAAKDKTDSNKPNQRLMMYKAYVQKNFPDWTIQPNSGGLNSKVWMTKNT